MSDISLSAGNFYSLNLISSKNDNNLLAESIF